MSNFYLKIILCAGLGFYAFPTFSAEKTPSKERDIFPSPALRSNPSTAQAQKSPKSGESGHGRKRSNSDDPSLRQHLMKDLQLVQKAKQALLTDYPKVLTATQIASIINAPYIDKRSSTEAIEIAPHLWVSVKTGDTAWCNLRKAVHPTYLAAATGVAHQGYFLKSSTFDKLQVTYGDVIVVPPAITAKFFDMIMFDYQGETVKAQKAKGESDVKGEMARYQLMIGDAVLQYPVSSAGGIKMSDAYLPLSFTFVQKEEKAREQKVDEKSTEGSLNKKEKAKTDLLPPSYHSPSVSTAAHAQPGQLKKALPAIPSPSQSKEKGAPQLASATPSIAGSTDVPRPRAASAPKPGAPKLLQKLKATQVDVQKTIREYPEKLIASQLQLILNAEHDSVRGSTVPVKLEGSNFWISAKLTDIGLTLLRKAVTADYIVDKIPFNLLSLARNTVTVYPQVVAYAGHYLQPVYAGQTVTTAQSDGSTADGTLMQYMLKVGEEPLTYPDGRDTKMIKAILELSITRIAGGKQ